MSLPAAPVRVSFPSGHTLSPVTSFDAQGQAPPAPGDLFFLHLPRTNSPASSLSTQIVAGTALPPLSTRSSPHWAVVKRVELVEDTQSENQYYRLTVYPLRSFRGNPSHYHSLRPHDRLFLLPIPPISPEYPDPLPWKTPLEFGGFTNNCTSWLWLSDHVFNFPTNRKFKRMIPHVRLSSDEMGRISDYQAMTIDYLEYLGEDAPPVAAISAVAAVPPSPGGGHGRGSLADRGNNAPGRGGSGEGNRGGRGGSDRGNRGGSGGRGGGGGGGGRGHNHGSRGSGGRGSARGAWGNRGAFRGIRGGFAGSHSRGSRGRGAGCTPSRYDATLKTRARPHAPPITNLSRAKPLVSSIPISSPPFEYYPFAEDVQSSDFEASSFDDVLNFPDRREEIKKVEEQTQMSIERVRGVQQWRAQVRGAPLLSPC